MKTVAGADPNRANASSPVAEEESSGVWPSRDQVSVSLRRPSASTLSTLVVRAPKQWDIAASLYRTLFDVRVQIVHGGIRRMGDERRVEHRLELVEFDGAPMQRIRCEEVELAICDLLDEVAARHDSTNAVPETA